MNVVEKINKYLEEAEAPEKSITGTRDLVKKNPVLPDDGTDTEVDPKCKMNNREWFNKNKKLPVDQDGRGTADLDGKCVTDPKEWLNKQANIKP